MDKFTADKIRSDFIKPLEALVRDLGTVADGLEVAYEERDVKKPWLPLNEVSAKKALKTLQRFLKKEARQKLDDAKEGALRYRDAELKFGKRKQKRTAEANGDEK